MKSMFRTAMVCAAVSVALGNYCHAVVVPFTEDFTSNGANWADIASAPVSYVASGGPSNDGYVASSAAFSSAPMNTNGIGVFRAHNAFDSSGDAFVGNWNTAKVTKVSAYFRHHETEAGLELTPFVRVATSSNFPGFAIEASSPIPANQWTKIVFEVNPSNPLLTVEGPPSFFTSAMNSVGNLQFGFSFPESFAGNQVVRSFDLDRVSIAPEPGTIGLLFAAVMSISAFARKCGS
jgi:hypothetical protein